MYTITVQAADGTEVIRTTATEIGLTAVRAVCGLAAPAPAPRPGRGRRGEKKKMTEEGSNAHRARILIRAVTTGKWLTGAPISRTYAFRRLREMMQTGKLYDATRKQAETACNRYLQELAFATMGEGETHVWAGGQRIDDTGAPNLARMQGIAVGHESGD